MYGMYYTSPAMIRRQRVLTGIDTNGVRNCGVCFAGHGVLLVLLKPPTDSACRWGREHGRSIPFATIRTLALKGRFRTILLQKSVAGFCEQ